MWRWYCISLSPPAQEEFAPVFLLLPCAILQIPGQVTPSFIMVRSSKFLSIALLLFPTLILGGAEIAGRELESEGDNDVPDAEVYDMQTAGGDDTFGAMPLDARSLVESWLGKRAECVNSGYSPCSSRLEPSLFDLFLTIRR